MGQGGRVIFDCNRQQTNLEPLALLCGEAHIPRGSLSFYTQKETSKIDLLLW